MKAKVEALEKEKAQLTTTLDSYKDKEKKWNEDSKKQNGEIDSLKKQLEDSKKKSKTR